MNMMLTIFSRRRQANLLLLLLLSLGWATAGATGIQDVAPTADDAPVMLETSGGTGFADFDGTVNNRLVVSFASANEALHIGLAAEYRRDGTAYGSNTFASYRFRIRRLTEDGANPVVHGPFTVSNTTANVSSYADAVFGAYSLDRVIDGDSVYLFRPEEAGDYAIEFDDLINDGAPEVNIPFWDFTVVDGNTPVPGRLWSRAWAFRTPVVDGTMVPDCVWDREFNGDLFSYTDDGFVSRINFDGAGFQGLSFRVAFSEFGPGTSGDIAADRQSIPGVNAAITSAQHRIFLVEPDIILFPDGICGEVTSGESFVCDENGDLCLDVAVTRPGQVDILLDFNGNGVLDDNTQDVALVYEFTATDLATCVRWDGLRGDGTPVDFTDTVDVVLSYAQGVQHWSAFDVEFMRNGFCVETIRPTCSGEVTSDRLFWDDRNIPEDPGTGTPKDNRSGAECTAVPRTWDNFILNSEDCSNFNDDNTVGYGDKNTINTWWVANRQTTFQARVPVVSASISGAMTFCTGDTITLTAQDATIVGDDEGYLWSGPGIDGATTESVQILSGGVFCVVVTNELGCSSETCVTIEESVFEANQFPPDLEVCFGDSVRLPQPANPAFTYNWTPATGISSTTSNNPVFFPSETTVYTASITGPSNTGEICEVTESIVIEVFPDIGLFVFGGGDICADSTTINATTQSDAEVVLFGPGGVAIGTGNTFTVPVSGETTYTLVATNPQSCIDSAFFAVSGGPVNVSLPDSIQACLSEEINLAVTNLDANDELTYAWTPAELFTPESVNTANPVYIGPEGALTVAVEITNQYGCTVNEEVELLLFDDGGALSFAPEVDCDGRTVSFTNTSTAGFDYVYDFGDGNTSSEPSPTHVYDTPGTYTVTLDLNYDQDCIASVSQEVTVFESLLTAGLSFSFGDCDNGSASLTFADESFNATGEALTYEWTFTGALPATASVANPTVVLTESGEVSATLRVSGTSACVSSVDTTFTVELAVVSLAEEVIICPGETTALNPDGNPDLIYSWSPAPDFDPSAVNPVTGEAGTYVVTVTSTSADFNCENTDTITVVIPDSIGLVVSGPNGPVDGAGNDGGTIQLPFVQTCGVPVDLTIGLNATGNDVTITYTDPEGNVLGTGETFTANPSGRDTVIVTAVNEFGCTETDTVVIINRQVDAGVNVGADGLNLCSATDTSVTVLNFDETDELTYAWEANPAINGALDGPTVDITTPDEGSVDLVVVVTNQFGCDSTLTVPVTAVPFLPNAFPDTIRPCFGEDITFTNGDDAALGYTYEWTPADNLDLSDPANPVGNFTEDTELTVLITDPLTDCSEEQTVFVDVAPEIAFGVDPPLTNICGTGIITIEGATVNPAVVITWYNDPERTDEAGTGPFFTINANEMGASYTIYGQAVDTITGCSQTGEATVNTTAFDPNEYPPVIMPCFGDEFTIQGGTAIAGLVYEWNPSDNLDLTDPANPVGVWTQDGTVSVTITDPATGCTETQTITVDVAPEISFMVSPADTILCAPDTIVIGGSSVNGNVEIVWYDDPDLTNEIGQGATLTVEASETGQTYTVYGQATDPTTGCQQVVSTTVTVSDLTAGLPLNDVATCFGENPPLFGPSGALSNLEYTYVPGDVVDLSDPNNPVFTGTESVDILVTAVDPATGCSVETTISVAVTNITNLEGFATPDTIFVGETSELEVLGCDDCAYEWFPQDGTVVPTTGSTVIATPLEEGDYTYEVDVTQNGCMETVFIELRVEDPICDAERIYVPNVFTPNGDGENDVMLVRSKFAELITDFRFIIYNRWGQEVFSSTDIFQGWDGTAEGDDLEPDVYGYHLILTCPAGQEFEQKGNISILR